MELFDRKYLHCMWSEEIDGKKCLLSDNLIDLIKDVNNGTTFDPEVIIACGHVKRSDGVQITAVDGTTWVYAYYDPNYDVKVAYNEGKQIEYRDPESISWYDATNPKWRDDVEYRVKSVEPKRMTYRQLAEWLAKGNGQSRYKKGNPTTGFMYDHEYESKPLEEYFEIRHWGSDEWIEPTYEIYEEDCIIKE